jgi:hypothetical protein
VSAGIKKEIVPDNALLNTEPSTVGNAKFPKASDNCTEKTFEELYIPPAV